MAKDTKQAAPAAGDEKPKSRGKLIVIIAVVLVVLLGGGGAAAYFLLKDSGDADSEEAAPEKAKKKEKGGHAAAPAYVSLDRFTVNLVPETGDQYLQVELSVELEDLLASEKLKLHMPKLRNQVMLLLSSKKASELNSKEGKEHLAKEMEEQMNLVLAPENKGKGGPVKEVLFTSFIIQ